MTSLKRNLWLMLGALILVGCCVPSLECAAQTREEKVRADRQRVESEGFWIYNDLPRAFQEAKRTGKPIVVVLRCIPCEECVKLDDDLVDQDPVIRPLLEQFVCVRQVSTNGLDLNLFQFDTDQSFAVFFLNADQTIYGRFGTRSHRTEWVQDVSLPGLAAALRGALDLHREYPRNRESLANKRGSAPLFPRPEKFPSLARKYTDRLNDSGNVVQSCIHCHQIGDAIRDHYRGKGEPIPEEVLYPYPHPTVVGWQLNPETAATLKAVLPNSLAATAGFQKGDQILKLNGQPILSSADVQWVLHQTSPRGGDVVATVQRGAETRTLTVQLPTGWRKSGDLSWRVSSWGLRRMSTGGLVLKSLTLEERRQSQLSREGMALRVDFVGQYNAHAAAKRAGFQKGDILVSIDGRDNLLTEDDVLAYGVTARKPGESVDVEVLRNGRRLTLKIPMQK